MTLLSHCADDSLHSILMRNLRLLQGFYEVKPIHVSSSTETVPSFQPLSQLFLIPLHFNVFRCMLHLLYITLTLPF